MRKPRLTWRKQPNETGLASIGQAPRGVELRLGGVRVGGVYPYREGLTHKYEGFYWTGTWNSSGHNSLWQHTVYRSEAEAKAALLAAYRADQPAEK